MDNDLLTSVYRLTRAPVFSSVDHMCRIQPEQIGRSDPAFGIFFFPIVRDADPDLLADVLDHKIICRNIFKR